MSEASRRPHRRPPRSVEEALRRAAGHSRRSIAEAIAAGRAVLDAAALGISGQTAEAHASLATLVHALDDLETSLDAGSGARSPILDVLAEALDAEIARWQERARSDREARAVLRAFLGLREVLWEVGVRGESAPSSAPAEPGAAAPADRTADELEDRGAAQSGHAARPRPERSGPARVQRIRVQGR